MTKSAKEVFAALYRCGDRSLLSSGGLAGVGSRHVEQELLDYTAAIGRMAAEAGRSEEGRYLNEPDAFSAYISFPPERVHI